MEVTSNGGSDFLQLGKKFRAAGKDGAAMRKALTKTIQAEMKKIVADQQHAVLSMDVKGTGGRGTARRELSAKPTKRPRDHRLRATTARAIKSKVSYSGYKLGARISISKNEFPNSQRKLPRNLNRRSGWRHPVWGHRDRWVAQVGEPFFDEPILRRRDEVRRAVDAAVSDVMKELTK